MMLVVEAMGSSLDASSPARYSPLRRSARAQARAATPGSLTSLAPVCCAEDDRHGESDEEACDPGSRNFEHGIIETTMILALRQGPW